MLSKAVASSPPPDSEHPATHQAHTLLHKCLAAMIQMQNVHAQQVVHYLWLW
jgi:hypothetical protein